MILLVTSSPRAQECAAALRESTTGPVDVAESLHRAAKYLRTVNYSAVVVDQLLMDAEPVEGEMLAQQMEMATPLYVNFAISGIARVVRELRLALLRRKKEESNARLSAQHNLRNELKAQLPRYCFPVRSQCKAPACPRVPNSSCER